MNQTTMNELKLTRKEAEVYEYLISIKCDKDIALKACKKIKPNSKTYKKIAVK